MAGKKKPAEASESVPGSLIDKQSLEVIARQARERVAEIAEKHDASSFFSLKWAAFADQAEQLIALMDEKGHTGVPA